MSRWFRFAGGELPEPNAPRGVWDGSWLGGVGASEGRSERTFVQWCNRRGYLCARTVEVFWFLRYHPNRFPRFNEQTLKGIWRYKSRKPQVILKHGVWELEDDQERKLEGKELRECVKLLHPSPGRWDFYFRRKRRYFMESLSRFKRLRKFWRFCSVGVKRRFFRCIRYGNKMPEAYPDYFVLFNTHHYGFVEVKGLRESIRPSQRRFFPELVKNASQRIWVVRIKPSSRLLRWYRVQPLGLWTHLADRRKGFLSAQPRSVPF